MTAGESFDISKGDFTPPSPKSTDELQSALNHSAEVVENTPKAVNEKTLVRTMATDARGYSANRSSPRGGVAIDDAEPLVPARGQLSVYLRLSGRVTDSGIST